MTPITEIGVVKTVTTFFHIIHISLCERLCKVIHMSLCESHDKTQTDPPSTKKRRNKLYTKELRHNRRHLKQTLGQRHQTFTLKTVTRDKTVLEQYCCTQSSVTPGGTRETHTSTSTGNYYYDPLPLPERSPLVFSIFSTSRPVEPTLIQGGTEEGDYKNLGRDTS